MFKHKQKLLILLESQIKDENRHKIKQMIMEENPSAGDCSLTYPHPSYAVLNQFKSMSTCNQNCDKKTETGSCLPVFLVPSNSLSFFSTSVSCM